MSILKISQFKIKAIIKEEIQRVLSEMDVPLRGEPEVIINWSKQGLDPGAVNAGNSEDQHAGSYDKYKNKTRTLPLPPNLCGKLGSPIEPPLAKLENPKDSPVYYDFVQHPDTGYVLSTTCKDGETVSLKSALDIFFTEYRGMHQNQEGGRQERFTWWLANQLLKHNVGNTIIREEEPEPEVEEFDAGELEVDDSGKIQGLTFENRLILEDQKAEKMNPYEKHIYDSIVGIELNNYQNVVNISRIKELAEDLNVKQLAILSDPTLALFKMYKCTKVSYPLFDYGETWEEKRSLNWREWAGEYDPIGELGQGCQFTGWTLEPSYADKNRNIFF